MSWDIGYAIGAIILFPVVMVLLVFVGYVLQASVPAIWASLIKWVKHQRKP